MLLHVDISGLMKLSSHRMASQHPQISKISQQSRNGSVVTVVPCQISIQEKGRKSPVISKRALFNIFAPGIAHCGKKREQIF